ncbi:MAG: lamin tail domain-containing protein [Caldilinea sp.]
MITYSFAAVILHALLVMLGGVLLLPGGDQADTRQISTNPPIVINEIFAHSDGRNDAVELLNNGPTAVDLSGWLLTDDITRAQSDWARIPNGITLAPGALYVSTEKDKQNGDWRFALHEGGETVYLLRPDPEGGAPILVEEVIFGASPNGVSFIRYVDSTGRVQYPLQAGSPTLGFPNRSPRISPVIIEEIMHHPPSGEAEYVVIANVSALSVDLYDPLFPNNTWKFIGQNQSGADHEMFDFAGPITLAPYERIILSEVAPDDLRRERSILANARVFKWDTGGLNNTRERVALMAPQPPESDGITVYYVMVDEVEYNYDPESDLPIWPAASGNGLALRRIDAGAYANDVINWQAASPLGTVNPRIYLPFVSGGE